MRSMTQEEIKKEELRVLIAFRDFCDEHHLKYALAFGTMLGAVRHNGFIPWDNDIDVMMLREDYEKLTEIYEDGFRDTRLLSYKKDPGYIYPFTKIVSARTYVKEDNTQEKLRSKDMGVWIDVFPVDDLGDHPTKEIWKKSRFLQRCMICKMKGLKKFTNNWVHFDRIFKYGIYCSRHSLAEVRNALDNRLSENFGKKTKFVGPVVWTTVKCPVPREAWDHLTLHDFEGEKFTIYDIETTDSFLKQLYGDYMTPPPLRKRNPHDIEAYWRDK